MQNPIVERELISLLRTRKSVAMQVVPAVACSLLVLLRWPSADQVDLSGTQSRQVFQLFGYGVLITLVLLVPAFPATSLVRERIRGSLALLLHTPMSPWSIYVGKLVGMLGFAYLPLIASLPAAAACYVMGGISARDEVLLLYAILVLVILQYTTLGLFVSSFAGSIDSALRNTYGLVLVMVVVTLGPYQILQGKAGILPLLAGWLRSVSPLPAVMEILGHGDIAGQGLIARTGAPARYAIMAILTSLGFAVATALRLRPTLFDRPRSQGIVTDERKRSERWLRRLVFIVDPQRRSRPIGPLTNPVMVKEFRCRRFGRAQWLLRLVAVCAVVSLLLSLISTSTALDWGEGTASALMITLQGALIVLLTPSLAAGLISAEIESGGWSLLQMTPLSPGRILRGKLLSVLGTLVLILLSTLPGYALMVYVKPYLVQQVVQVFLCLLLTGLFALMLGAAVGSFFRRTAAATLTSYALLLSVCAGTMLFWLGREQVFGHPLVEKVLSINPLAAAMSVMGARGFENYRLVPACWWIVGTTTVVLFVVLRFRVWRLTRPQ